MSDWPHLTHDSSSLQTFICEQEGEHVTSQWQLMYCDSIPRAKIGATKKSGSMNEVMVSSIVQAI